jgi:hypothetical protein
VPEWRIRRVLAPDGYRRGMNVAEEFALLAYDDDGSPVLDGSRLNHGLAGALLLELALAGRVDVTDGRVVVRDATPTGDALVDGTLDRIAGDDRPNKPGHWVSALAKDVREQVLDRLVADGVLRREQDRVLWVFPRTRYPAPHGVEPAAEAQARQRMRAAVAGTGPVESRTAALCALVAATGLDRKIFADLDRKQTAARLAEIGAGAWAAASVKKTVEEIEAAVTITVITAVS